MRAVVQRVARASVTIDGKEVAAIGKGFLILLGVTHEDGSEQADFLAQKCAGYLDAALNPDFDPHRKAISEKSGPIICQCESITEGEILQAIARGARTVEAVKRRVGSGMGPCQGGRCSSEILKLLNKSGIHPDPLF